MNWMRLKIRPGRSLRTLGRKINSQFQKASLLACLSCLLSDCLPLLFRKRFLYVVFCQLINKQVERLVETKTADVINSQMSLGRLRLSRVFSSVVWNKCPRATEVPVVTTGFLPSSCDVSSTSSLSGRPRMDRIMLA